MENIHNKSNISLDLFIFITSKKLLYRHFFIPYCEGMERLSGCIILIDSESRKNIFGCFFYDIFYLF